MTWLELNEEWGALIAPNATYEVNSPVWSWLFSQSLSGTRIPPCQLSWLLQLYIYSVFHFFSCSKWSKAKFSYLELLWKRALWVCLEFAFCATLEISLFSWWNFLLNAIVDAGLRLNNINLFVPYVTVRSTFFILFHINALLLTILTTNGIKTPLPQHKQYSYKEIININFAFTSITARV